MTILSFFALASRVQPVRVAISREVVKLPSSQSRCFERIFEILSFTSRGVERSFDLVLLIKTPSFLNFPYYLIAGDASVRSRKRGRWPQPFEHRGKSIDRTDDPNPGACGLHTAKFNRLRSR
jgi:hypothetical protein